MDIIELFLDEENEHAGIEAVSLVSAGAIESDFIALKNQEFKMAVVDKEQRILLGAALIPLKPIYRQNEKILMAIMYSFQKLLLKKLLKCFSLKATNPKQP